MSGFTTTGATVLTHIEEMPDSLLFWRQFTQWLGGMGISCSRSRCSLVCGSAAGSCSRRAPGPGVRADLRPGSADGASALGLYVGLTVAMALFLSGSAGRDRRRDGSLRGAGPRLLDVPDRRLLSLRPAAETFAPASQWVIAVFMLIAGVNFALLYLLFVRADPWPSSATRSSVSTRRCFCSVPRDDGRALDRGNRQGRGGVPSTRSSRSSR